jgi:hypothetical protein
MAEREEWPGVPTEDLPWSVEADVRKHLRMRLKDTDQVHALEILTTAGCNFEALFEGLVRIRRSREWNTISKAELRRCIGALRTARTALVRLKQSELARAVLVHPVRADRISDELGWVIAGAEAVVPEVTGKRTPRSDTAIVDVVKLVRNATGQYHDEEVSCLISGAWELSPEQPWTSESLRQWRHRHGLTSE